MQERRYTVNLPEGAELSKSRKDPGAFSALARDADGKLVHGTLTLDDDSSQDQGQLPTTQPTISQQLLVTAVNAVIEATTDAFTNWWEEGGREQTRRRLRRSWDRFKARRAPADTGDANTLPSSAPEVAATIEESASSKAGCIPAAVAVTERPELTVREAELAMLRLVVGELYVQHQRELLAGARVIPDRKTTKQLAEQLAKLEELGVDGLRQGLKELVESSPDLLPPDLVTEIDALVGALADSRMSAGEGVLGESDSEHDLPRA